MAQISAIRHESGAGFTLNFLNGSIEIPDDPGAYAISSGCGSGKTTCIREMIRTSADKGVIYCVDTLEALEAMYRNIMEDIDTGKLKNTLKDEIMCLRGERRENDGQDVIFNEQLRQYKDRPEEICRKKVILLTHARFFSELIQYFITYTDEPAVVSSVPCFDGDFSRLMTSEHLRKYIIFDETPNFWTPLAKIPVCLLWGLTMDEREDGERKFYDDILSRYEQVSSAAVNPLKEGTLFQKQRKFTVLSMLKNGYLKGWEQSGIKDFDIYFRPKDLIQPEMNAHVLLFEGAADVLLQGTQAFNLIDVSAKYNAKVSFSKFDFDLKRHEKQGNTADRYVKVAHEILNKLYGGTLIVAWKNISGIDKGAVGESKFCEELESGLRKMGLSDFSVIYYGSPQCKSTNNYRTYKNIIFLGDWNIGAGDLNLTREAYRTPILDLDSWKAYYFIQIISRIGVRNHCGGEFNAYFSSDFSDGFIEVLNRYFNQNTPYEKPVRDEKDAFEEAIKTLKDARYRSYVRNLSNRYPQVRDAIVTSTPISLFIPFEQLVKLCPRESASIFPKMYKPFARAILDWRGIKFSTSTRRGGKVDLN